jgi:2-amino-4-hydroxy-6-hydroxymethyldihydropteridine diphosphokinase
MPVAYLLLGTNLGDRLQNLAVSTGLLEADAGTIIHRSAVYESEPWGFEHPDWFYNQLLVIETSLGPLPLMEIALQVEKHMGRERNQGTYAARIIDIDILMYDRLEMRESQLIIPHPRINERKFALQPLAEIDPTLEIPGTGSNVWKLLRSCRDTGWVRRIHPTVHPA